MSLTTVRAKPQLWLRTALTVALLLVLFFWLWQFRIAALLRHEAAGQVVSRAPLFSADGAPLWLVPIFSTVNYLNTTWETTLVALLMAGTLQTFLHAPLLRLLKTQTGWRAYFAGVAFGLPNVLCTCCAAPLFAGLYKRGAPLGTALATLITAPSLNLAVLVLALAFLPLPLALARIGLGLAAALAVPYLAARISRIPPPVMVQEAEGDVLEWNDLVFEWLKNIWQMTRLTLPLLILGYLLVGVLQLFVPLKTVAPVLGDGLVPLILVALISTLVMVPTFSEIALVSTLVPLGMGMAPAIALLITAPAVSLPSLIVIGRATHSWRIPLVVGSLVFLMGTIGGLVCSAFVS